MNADFPCDHRFTYYKVVKKQEDFMDNVTRKCKRCMLQEFVRPLRPHEKNKVGVFKV